MSRAEALDAHVPDDRGRLPKVEVEDMKYAADPRRKAIVVSGRVRAPRRAIFALTADESDARPGEYWTKTYVGKVAPDGAFEVVTRAEIVNPSGAARVWLPLPLMTDTDYQKSLGQTWTGNAAVARVARDGPPLTD